VIAGFGAGLWALLQLSPVSAAELSIATPAACSVADELTFRTERALGQPIAAAAAVRCTIHIARSSGMYAARMEVESIGSGRPSRLRSFSAPTCEKLTETLALAVVLAIGAGESAQPSPASPAGAPQVSESRLALGENPGGQQGNAVPDADAPAPDAEPSASADSGPRVAAAAALVGDAGSLPGVGLGFSLGASLGWDAVELRLLGTYLPAREASIEASSVAEISLLAGSLAACLPRLLSTAALELGVCAGAELGWLAGSGTGLDVSRSGGGLWTALRADASARWALGAGVGLDLLLSGLVPTKRDEFAIEGFGSIFQPSVVVGRVSLGVSVLFGAAEASGQ
jgi:hypothetical protein